MAQLGKRQKDGNTLYDHLRAVWNATGRKPEELEIDDLPPCAVSVLIIFQELSNARPAGLGLAPIGHAGLLAWQQLHGVDLTHWEIETLLDMDQEFMKPRAE